MHLLSERKLPLVALVLAGCLLLLALPAQAADSRLVPPSLNWQSLWEQVLSWIGLGGEGESTGSGDQQWSHAAGKEDAGPYIDPNGLPGTNGSNGQGDDGTAIQPIGTR
jgi:hypothetical protein